MILRVVLHSHLEDANYFDIWLTDEKDIPEMCEVLQADFVSSHPDAGIAMPSHKMCT
jgi:hypothetical protein